MGNVVNTRQTILALLQGEATLEQQRETACLLLLMKQLGNWECAEETYLMLRASNMIDLRPTGETNG